MKFINSLVFKSFFTVLAALACGQAVGFPLTVNVLTKTIKPEQGEEYLVTIYSVGDCHKFRTTDESNAQAVVQFAQQLNATLIVESSAHDSDLNTTKYTNKSTSPGYNAGYSPESCRYFLHKTYQLAKEQKINLSNAETRQILMTGDSVHNLTITYIKEIITKLQEKIKDESQDTFKQYCDKTLKQMPIFSECETFQPKNPDLSYSFSGAIHETPELTDIKIVLDLSQGLQQGQKNFIICSGVRHTEAIEQFLSTEMGFHIETLFEGRPEKVIALISQHPDWSLNDVADKLYGSNWQNPDASYWKLTDSLKEADLGNLFHLKNMVNIPKQPITLSQPTEVVDKK